jgi:hypothetical protein
MPFLGLGVELVSSQDVWRREFSPSWHMFQNEQSNTGLLFISFRPRDRSGHEVTFSWTSRALFVVLKYMLMHSHRFDMLCRTYEKRIEFCWPEGKKSFRWGAGCLPDITGIP